jgi:hypothetical protein
MKAFRCAKYHLDKPTEKYYYANQFASQTIFQKGYPMTTDPLQNAQKRTFQYWYLDGTFEFSFGGLCLILATYFYATYLLADYWQKVNLPVEMLIFLLAFVGGGFLINRLVMTMKERITFPRTGYIAFPRKTGSSRWRRILLISILSASVSALMTVLLMKRPANFDWTVAASGLLFCGVVVYLGIRSGVGRFFITATASLVLGIAFGYANLPENLGPAAFYGTLGTAMLLIGGLSLWRYLRQNPTQTEAWDDQ